MKTFIFLVGLTILTSCQHSTNDQKVDYKPKDSISTDTLDHLFKIADEKELAAVFGKENVVFDTVYGAEGEMSFATLLFPMTPNQVVIRWKSMKKLKGMKSIEHTAWFDQENEKLLMNSRWKTKKGIRLGTPLSQLVKMNGKPLTFYGFGWDYGGTVSSFNGGSFEKCGIQIQLGITDFLNQGNDPDYFELTGDMEINSDNPHAIALDPVVIAITLSR